MRSYSLATSRLATSNRVQITTDGLGMYSEPIQKYFYHRAGHGSEVKDYGLLDDDAPERKYSPMVVKSVIRTSIFLGGGPIRTI